METLKHTAQLGQQLAEKEYEYAQLKFFYQATSISASVVKKSIIAFLAMIALLFLSLAAAFGLGDALDSTVLGFLWIGIGYVAIIGVALLLRKKIEKYVIQKMADKYF